MGDTAAGPNMNKEGLSVLESILNETTSNITMVHMAVCTTVSLALGLILAAVHMYRNQSSRSRTPDRQTQPRQNRRQSRTISRSRTPGRERSMRK